MRALQLAAVPGCTFPTSRGSLCSYARCGTLRLTLRRASSDIGRPCAQHRSAVESAVRNAVASQPCQPLIEPSYLGIPLSWTENILSVCLSARRGSEARLRQGSIAQRKRSHNVHVLACLAAFVPPALPAGGFNDLISNRVLMAGFIAWLLAQFLKIFTKRFKKGVWDVRAFVDSGGMPSSHSALCTAITTAIAMTQGFGSPLFATALAFSAIVMYDAAGVRRHAGKHAEVLNQVVLEVMVNHPVGEIKLKEVLGHTPRQVICGAILGILVGIFYPAT